MDAAKKKSTAHLKKEKTKLKQEMMAKAAAKNFKVSEEQVKDELIAWMDKHPKAASHLLHQVKMGIFDAFDRTGGSSSSTMSGSFKDYVNKFKLLPLSSR
jgi:choline dehydrogenase-like flavoprotein